MTKRRLAWNALMVRTPAPLTRVLGRDSKRLDKERPHEQRERHGDNDDLGILSYN